SPATSPATSREPKPENTATPQPQPPPTTTVARRIGIASLIWGASILLSRAIGLIREGAIGRILGGGREADVFLASFIVPDFLSYLLAGGALSIVFIPIFSSYISKGQDDRGWEAFSVIANCLLILLGIATITLWLTVPWLVSIVAPGFDSHQHSELVNLTRIILPAQVFHLVGGLLSAALQARDKHGLPALAPLLYTSSIVIGGLIGGTEAGAYGFAWGALIGSFLGPFGLPLIGCLRTGLSWRLTIRFNHPDLRTYILRSLPIMLGWSIVVVDDWLLGRFGSIVGESTIATLHYSKTLLKVPMGVFGLAAGVAAFPSLSRLIAQDKHAEAYSALSSSVRRMLVLAIASQVALAAAGQEAATIIYGGKIPQDQYVTMGWVLGIMSLSLWAWAAQTVIARGYYALGRTWEPTVIGTAIVVLAYPIYWAAAPYGALGLAGASALSISAYTVVLALRLRKYFPGIADHYRKFALRFGASAAVGTGAGLFVRHILSDAQMLVRGSVAASVGVLAFCAVAFLLRAEELREVVTWAMRGAMGRTSRVTTRLQPRS
ncbi:MAG: murein biosynthesis integral membrane protein MurJ, partial [Polyangiaceae bacterium]|nr:murein biosynthesis integral membrane protein MurJ [Polyangiaceae bacterium]